mmetsp:Transcript_15730/g.29392  ORF Transcript_15730/g.29392 Transcript_15730/m.29392 type:complete len:236 (-) Transcript_15730:1997-2704(-)
MFMSRSALTARASNIEMDFARLATRLLSRTTMPNNVFMPSSAVSTVTGLSPCIDLNSLDVRKLTAFLAPLYFCPLSLASPSIPFPSILLSCLIRPSFLASFFSSASRWSSRVHASRASMSSMRSSHSIASLSAAASFLLTSSNLPPNHLLSSSGFTADCALLAPPPLMDMDRLPSKMPSSPALFMTPLFKVCIRRTLSASLYLLLVLLASSSLSLLIFLALSAMARCLPASCFHL